MSAFATAVDTLAAPPRLFALALVVFLTCRGNKLLWSRAGGWTLLALTAAFFGAGLADATFRALIFHPERLPVVVLVLASGGVLWAEMRRARLADGDPGAARRSPPGAPLDADRLAGAPDRRRPWLRSADAAVATAAGLALMALALLWPAPLGPEADPGSRPDLVKAPWFFVGLQELDAYFDPWVPFLALPLLLLAGLLGLPFLEAAPPEAGQRGGDAGGGRRRALFLLGWLLLWLWPMAVGALLRGPHWNAFGPFETWDPSRPAPLAPRPLSEVVWLGWLRGFEPESWWLRELPGAALLGGYFVLLPMALRRLRPTRGAYRSYRKAMGAWRFRAALAWVLAMMVVPLKMYGQWLLDVGPWIHLPELSFNF